MTEIPASLAAATGRIVTADDVVTAAPVAAMMATFGREGPAPVEGDPLPPLWHGMFCTAKLPPDRLGADGLAKDEGLLPEATGFPHKLFGGARFSFDRPVRIGEAIRKESEIMGFEAKEGRSGAFLVGRVQHRVVTEGGIAIVEDNDIIFRAASGGGGSGASPPSAAAEAPAAAWRRTITPDPVLMFRHSALTFNSHRIHYDRDYARERGFPGLLVQGMLIARLMLEMVRDGMPGREVGTFAFRSGRPIHDTGDFTLSGDPAADGGSVTLVARDADGHVGMTAEATFR